MQSIARRGFTLIELLVVLAILGVLMALLVPAVQSVRHAAARTECSNNIRQLGLALHQYHGSRKTFPSGVTSAGPRELYARMTWHARLLPYLEQNAVWRSTIQAYERQPNPFADPPHPGLATPLVVFGCPSDDRIGSPQSTHLGLRVALTSYVGILGTDYRSRHGVLFENSRTRLSEITDGSSNTLMVAERPASADKWYGWWYAGVGQAGTGSLDMLLGTRERSLGDSYVWICPPGPYHFKPGTLNEQCDVFHFWSLHPGGSHFLFADGSVRFLAYDADPLLPALATRAGGEVTQPP